MTSQPEAIRRCEWFLGRAQPVRSVVGRISRWVGTWTDIEDQKRTEADLERALAERTETLRLKENEFFQTGTMEGAPLFSVSSHDLLHS